MEKRTCISVFYFIDLPLLGENRFFLFFSFVDESESLLLVGEDVYLDPTRVSRMIYLIKKDGKEEMENDWVVEIGHLWSNQVLVNRRW